MTGLTAETPIDQALALYLGQHRSAATVRTYRHVLGQAVVALGVASLSEVTLPMLATWRAALLAERRSSSATAIRLAALRSFLAWTRLLGLHQLDSGEVRAALRSVPVKVIRPYHALSEPEVAALLVAAESPRDRAIVSILLGAGLRAAELVALDVDDVIPDADGAVLHVRAGKGEKDRLVPVRPEVWAAIDAYAGCRASGPLILSEEPGAVARRLTTGGLRHVLAALVDAAGIAGRISPHALRHSYATRARRGGADVVVIQRLLGHSSLVTTQRYLDHVGLEELRAAVPALT